MNKAKTKDGLTKQSRRYNTQVIKVIASKRNISEDYVRQCLRGDRNSETAEDIRIEYAELSFKMSNTLLG